MALKDNMIIVNLTQVLGLDYFDFNLESDNTFQNETNESRYLILSHDDFNELAEVVAKVGKDINEVHYIVYSDDEVDYWNLYYQELKATPEYVEIHFYV